MHRWKKWHTALIAVVAISTLAGMVALLRPPAQKPLPPDPLPAPSQPEITSQVQPIPGVPLLDLAKYRNEPMVTVWFADKGMSEAMPLETYLEGVVAREMEPSWPVEALRAQAIASRTLTLSSIEAGTIRRLHKADVSTAKEELQAYAPERVNDAVRTAVEGTRGQVLLYAGSLVQAIYSASNGQISATREESFPKEITVPTPYFQPVTDDSFRFTPLELQNWSVTIPAGEVASAVGYEGNPGDIQILERGPSGRILFIGAGNREIFGAEFRRAVGFDRLKSTLVDEMTYDGGRFIFRGRGWGNGVGLCQWGAYTYAVDGKQAEEILAHYYVGATITRLWE